MFNPIILQKLRELDIHTITQAVKEAQQEENLLNITVRVEPPYFFCEMSIHKAKEIIYKPNIIGYIAVNGIAYTIAYIKDKDRQELVLRDYGNKIHDNIFLDLYQHIEIKHKKKPGKSTSDETITFDTFETSSIFDELQEASNELPNTYYPQKHPYIYVYEQALQKECFTSAKFFKFFCTLTLIAEKSSMIIQKRNTCHITPKDLMAIIPQSFKRSTVKPKQTLPEEPQEMTSEEPLKRGYQKSYIKFLDFAYQAGMVREYKTLENGYIQIVFEDNFKNYFTQPPYIKLPFEFASKITKYNYKFLMYFVKKEFHNNPKYPCNVNISLKELLKLTNITTHDTLQNAAKRLNAYLAILQEYNVIRKEDIYIEPDDIHENKPLKFRLFHFRIFEDKPIEEVVTEEPREPKEPIKTKFELSEAFKRANKLIDNPE